MHSTARLAIIFGICALANASGLVASAQVRVVKDLAYKPDAATDYERERCKLDLYLPNRAAAFPTIVWFHGGGLQNGDKAREIEVHAGQRFAENGIALASVNYRLHPQAHFPAYVEDAAAAVAFVISSKRPS